MKVLLIGSGGREHALAHALSQSPLLDKLFAAPGNPGIGELAELVAVDPSDHQAVLAFCQTQAVDLVVVGPEQPLVDGLADSLRAGGVATFGPGREAARLEGSKAFTKELCAKHNIPTARWERCTDEGSAREACGAFGYPVVVKADGLAAGKGVVIAPDPDEAARAIAALLPVHGELVIEEFLEGEEVSLFALSDGQEVRLFGSAQDHKRVGDGDTGPNTGGMGAYSPATVLTPELEARTFHEIIEPTIAGLAARGTPFVGMLYAGLMLTAAGPKLIEYNVRMGDPEAEAILPRFRGDLCKLFHATARGELAQAHYEFDGQTALTVVVAARGYPDEPVKGGRLTLPEPNAVAIIYQAGTRSSDGELVASGGRVLAVTGLGRDIVEARERAYGAIGRIDFADGFTRSDIGWREIARVRKSD